MSLQVCHCGWSKVTTYQGLRIHQGKMGCTPRGMRVEESEQQHMWGNVGFTNDQKDLRLDIYTSIKTDTTDYYSDMSLQVCHCGWSKVTTYQGLRIHQGKMGCTPKGMRIPKREQYDWKNQWEEVDQRKHQPAKRMTVKKENAPLPPSPPSPPSTKVRTNSAATTATVKEEYKSSFATSQHSFQTATNSKSRRQLHYFSTGAQVNRSVREHPTPTYPVTVLRPTEKDRKDQTLSRIADSSRVMTGNWSINSHTDSATTAATIKEEPKSPLAIPQRSSQTARNSKYGHQLQDFSTGVQVNRSFRERPTIPPPITVVQPKEKDRKDQTLSRVKSLVRERPKTTYPATVVRPKEKHREDQTLSQSCLSDFASSCSITTINSRPGVQVNRSSRECPTAPPVAAVVQPKKKDRKDQTLSQGSLYAEWLEINSVFSEVVRVVKDAKQKSLDPSFSIGTLRTTTSTMMEQIHQKLEKLSSLELKWISKFTVDVKLDPATADRCLVSADGKKVRNGGENQEAPGRFGSVLGLNRLTSGRSYWEVVVSNRTGWELGVVRGDANRRGKLSLNPDNGYWVTVHYENKEYAALSAPPVRLSLKGKPQKVGVFVDYEEGLVSFYDVTAQSHIYSFTECSFTGEIYPYFSLQLKEDGERADPLIISTVKHQ